jgi:uncharacterized protein YecE (DUF72 family)
MFGYYAERFRTVENNYTFYRMPTTKLTEGWRAQAADGFTSALKAPRRITHDKRLAGAGGLVSFFCESARGLGPHLGPLLFQLPPTFRADVPRLAAFLAELPQDVRAAFEFRHDSWLTDETYRALTDHRAALCIADFGDKTTPVVATARHGYFRLRDEGYTPADLQRWVDHARAHEADWDDLFVYFKHEEEGKGPEFAAAFRALLGQA